MIYHMFLAINVGIDKTDQSYPPLWNQAVNCLRSPQEMHVHQCGELRC